MSILERGAADSYRKGPPLALCDYLREALRASRRQAHTQTLDTTLTLAPQTQDGTPRVASAAPGILLLHHCVIADTGKHSHLTAAFLVSPIAGIYPDSDAAAWWRGR